MSSFEVPLLDFLSYRGLFSRRARARVCVFHAMFHTVLFGWWMGWVVCSVRSWLAVLCRRLFHAIPYFRVLRICGQNLSTQRPRGCGRGDRGRETHVFKSEKRAERKARVG